MGGRPEQERERAHDEPVRRLQRERRRRGLENELGARERWPAREGVRDARAPSGSAASSRTRARTHAHTHTSNGPFCGARRTDRPRGEMMMMRMMRDHETTREDHSSPPCARGPAGVGAAVRRWCSRAPARLRKAPDEVGEHPVTSRSFIRIPNARVRPAAL